MFLRFIQENRWWPFSNSGLGHERQTSVNCMAWRPASGATIALGTANGILIWRFAVVNGNIQFAKHLPSTSALISGQDNISTLAWAPHGRWLVAGLKDLSGLVLWDVSLAKYELLGSFSSLESLGWFRKTTLQCVWSDDGDYLLQILTDGGFRIWETETWTSLYYTTRSPIKDAVFIKDTKTVLVLIEGWIRFFSIASEPCEIELLNAPCSVKIKENAMRCKINGSNLLIIYPKSFTHAQISLEPLPKVAIIREIHQKEKEWIDVGFVNTMSETIYYQYSDGSLEVESL